MINAEPMVMTPACYVVPAAEFQSALAMIWWMPLALLGVWIVARAFLDWDTYAWQFRRARRWRRLRVLRQARAVS